MHYIIAKSLCQAGPFGDQRRDRPEKAERPGLASILGGLRYARSRQELIGTYAVDFVAMIFGMPTALFPAMSERFGGAAVLGYLYAAPSVGALAATLTSGWTPRVKRHGVAVLWAAFAWGVAIVGFYDARTPPPPLTPEPRSPAPSA